MKVRRRKVHPHNTVQAVIITSTRDERNLSMRALDGHASTLTKELTATFQPGDAIVILRSSDYAKLLK